MFRILTSFLVTCFTILTMAASVHAFTITVEEKTDGYDGSVCTLRNAVQTFNNQAAFGGCPFTDDAQPDTIVLLEGEYILSRGVSQQSGPDNSAGDLDLEVSMNIVGQGVDATTVSASGFPANDTDRVIQLFPNCEAGGCGDLEATLQGFTIRDGDTNGLGGGVYLGVSGARVNIDHMRLTANNAGEAGGGLLSYGENLITNSTFDNNTTGYGGGMYLAYSSGTLLQNSTVNNNMAVGQEIHGDGDVSSEGAFFFGDGGGVFTQGIFIGINSTISGNQAGQRGGGIFFSAGIRPMGAGSIVAAGPGEEFPYQLFNVTVADNTVLNSEIGYGGGLAMQNLSIDTIGEIANAGEVDGALIAQPFVSVANSLIARNNGLNGPDCFGAYNSQGFNLVTDPLDCLGFDQTGDQTDVADPGLGTLQDNGGPTLTQGLLAGSPAIDMGNNVEGCQIPDLNELINNDNYILTNLTEDQRQFPRPIAVLDPNNPICDIGAFEFQVFDFDVTKVDNVGGQTAVGNQFTYIITVTNSGPGVATSVLLTDPLPTQVTFNSVTTDQGTCMASGNTVECDLGTLNVGQTVTVQVLVTVITDGTFTNVVTVTSEGGDSQQSITKEAQTSTQTTGGGSVFVFGSGCQLAAWPTTGASSLAYLGFALLGLGLWRRRSR